MTITLQVTVEIPPGETGQQVAERVQKLFDYQVRSLNGKVHKLSPEMRAAKSSEAAPDKGIVSTVARRDPEAPAPEPGFELEGAQ